MARAQAEVIRQQMAEQAAREAEQAAREAERQRQQREERLQRQRDDAAQFYSYWPTTMRVDTDMNSFWLDQEEKTCMSYHDANGKVAGVSCQEKAHETHNIPVTFWGGVDRAVSSRWRCRREGEKFVCRAIN